MGKIRGLKGVFCVSICCFFILSAIPSNVLSSTVQNEKILLFEEGGVVEHKLNVQTIDWPVDMPLVPDFSYLEPLDGGDYQLYSKPVDGIRGTGVFDIPVVVGWNFVSVPFVQTDEDILAVLDDGGGDTIWDYALYYDATDPADVWKSYRSDWNPTYNQLLNINHRMGIWLQISDGGSDGLLTVDGDTLGSTDINLLEGWNMVGYPCLESKTMADALAGVPHGFVGCFDSGEPYDIREMLPSEHMGPGNAYWIWADSDCVWTVGDTTPPAFAGLVSATNTGTGGTVDLAWNPATDPSYPITYNVYMATSSGGQNFASPDYTTDQTTLQISGLTDEQEYFFVVRAEDSAGNEESNSVENSATPTAPDTTPPQIIITAPVDGAVDVAVNQDIVITFSETIDTATFAYTCNPNPGGWGEVWDSASFPDDRVTLSHSDFAFETPHTFQVTAADDLAGNPLVAGPLLNPWTFSTVVAPDIIPPQVVSNDPVDGAFDVSVSTNIVVTFTEEMNQVNTEGAFEIVPAVAGTFSWNPGGDIMTFNPSADLDWSTAYTITIHTTATDLAGNTLDGDKDGNMESDNKDKWVFSFTTESEPDLTGPIVSNVQGTPDPVNSGSPLTLTANVDDTTTGGSTIAEAEWSDGGAPASAGTGTPMSASDGTFDSVSEDVTVSIDTTGWPGGSRTLWVRGRDAQGNWGDAVSTVVGVIEPDTTPPEITNTVPADGAVDVDLTQNIIITFSEEMNPASVAYTCDPDPGGWGESWDPTNTILTLTHNDFAYETTYTFTVTSGQDLAGNPLAAGPVLNPWSFTTLDAPDTTGPITSGVAATPNPTEGAVLVTLVGTVDDTTTGGSNIAEAEYFVDFVGADGSGTPMAASDGNFNSPTEDITADVDVSGWALGDYVLYVHGRDAAGNWGLTASTTLSVTDAPDIIPPQVVSNDPVDGALDVPVSTNIVVTFTEEMNQANTEGAFEIVPAVAGTFSWNPGGDIMTFNPSADLDWSTGYTVTIHTAATDLAGNTLDGDKDGNMEADNKDKWVFSFTTESEPDLTGPIVSNVQGTPDPVNSGSPLTLTAHVDDTTTGGSTIAEAEWSDGASPANAGAGTPMSASDSGFDEVLEGVTATVDTTGWPDGSRTLWVRGRDAQGNWGDAVSTVVDVIGPDIIPPQVVSNDPADGATSVSVTTNIVVTFNEEMDQANTEGAFEIVPATAGSFSWNAAGTVLTFNPSSDLLGGEAYTVTIHVAATDLAGNTLDGDKDGVMEADNKDKWVFSFTTAGGGPGAKYAVVVGINKFTYLSDLTYCVADANEVRTNLNSDGYTVDLITDTQATKANILSALDDMGSSEVAGDYTGFTFSGHGGILSGKCVICPTEGYDLSTYIQKAELEAKFATYDSTHILIFFDSCNSGGMSTLGSAGRLCIMAAKSTQYSWDGQPDIANGVWTYYFWEDGYRDGMAGTTILEDVFTYAAPLAKTYVEVNYPPYTMDPQISDGYTGDFYL